jgi:hypothetical protein
MILIITIDQGAGTETKIAVQAKEPTIAKTRKPTTMARIITGIRAHNLLSEDTEGVSCWFISVIETTSLVLYCGLHLFTQKTLLALQGIYSKRLLPLIR